MPLPNLLLTQVSFLSLSLSFFRSLSLSFVLSLSLKYFSLSSFNITAGGGSVTLLNNVGAALAHVDDLLIDVLTTNGVVHVIDFG
jgi:hypothetical protein